MNQINAYIQKYYEVVLCGSAANEDDFSNVREFLLCDETGSCGHAIINSSFISQFASRKDAVFVEYIPSMREIQGTMATQSVWLNTAAKIMGWDIEEITTLQCGCEIFRQINECDIQKQLLLKRYAAIQYAGTTDIKTLTQLGKLSGQMFQIYRSIDEKTIREKQKNCSESRTQSMIRTLQQTEIQFPHRFVIADPSFLDHEDPSFEESQNLSSHFPENFYTFLKDRNVVVLRVKENEKLQIGWPMENLFFNSSLNSQNCYAKV